MSTWREALKAGEEMLVRAGVPDGAYDAWALMEFAFAMEKSYYFLHADDKMEEKQRERYQEVLEKRAERIPLQQIYRFRLVYGLSVLCERSRADSPV